MIDVDAFPSDTSWLFEPTTGVHQFGGGSIEKFVAQQNAEVIRRMNVVFRKGFSILSLSENVLSTLMWTHYGDSHMGFSIEYDFSKLPYGDLRRRLCFPVFYVSKVRDASRYIFRADVRDFNNLFGQFLGACPSNRIFLDEDGAS
jgi:hypothetical protein